MDRGTPGAGTGSAGHFDALAEEYGGWYSAATPLAHALQLRRARAVELLTGEAGRILDVGCGPGVLAPCLLDSGWEFFGVDASPRMVEQCRFAGKDRAQFVVGDATGLPFRRNSFDAVACLGVLDRISAQESAVGEMIRVLRVRGTLVISFPNRSSPYTQWKNGVYHRLGGWLRRSLGDGSHVVASARLHTPSSAQDLLSRYGADVTHVVYLYFNPFLAPLDQLFPSLSLNVTRRLESLSSSRLRCLGGAFVLKACKR